MACASENVPDQDHILRQDEEVRRQLRCVVDLLEGGLSELVKIAAELRSLIRTIDVVTKQVESRCGAEDLDKKCLDQSSYNFCWQERDINQNVPTSMSEVHWQTYASQDWFSGFKHFPRLKDAKDSIACFPNPSLNHVPCKYYDQITEVLLQIGRILNSLESSHTCQDDPVGSRACSDISSANGTVLYHSLRSPPKPPRLFRNESETGSSFKNSSFSSENSFDKSQNSYLSVLVDVNGDYEETVDYLLESLTGEDVEELEESSDSDKIEESSDEPPPVPVLKVYLRKYIDEPNNNSTMDNLQSYFD